ncbi:mRNA export factor mex67 [Vanrija pseudolonga]|uniref:mRNA export factor MEX67 n=1 Tax=Vanrija pseudolonga TaxID=143232 RepID=A0AAF0YC31_9TREE|nr:mRNA export factor mex67 [Vanrija pseudolonga]
MAQQGSSSGIAVRGASTRALSSALRGAGMSSDAGQGMDVDGGIGRTRGGRHRRSEARSAGNPLDQSGRHRPGKDTPYSKPDGKGSLSSRIGAVAGSSSSGGQAPARGAKGKRNINPRRNPEGTPDVLRDTNPKRAQVQSQQHSKLNEVLRGDEIKEWLKSRVIAPGVLDMSNLPGDAWLQEKGILPPGHKDAPVNVGHVFWKLISSTLETPGNPITTLSLAKNEFNTLHQLAKLPLCLPHIRALDLSDNPIAKSDELKHLQSAGEQKGKASTGAGSLKSLTELKLNGARFREETLLRPNGADIYQHDVLRRFPGLLILDGVQLNRIVFPLERKPVVKRTEEERKPLAAVPFSFPFDVVNTFKETDSVESTVMSFCQIFFTLFDNNRTELVDIYHPEATLSIAANTLPSRSAQAADVSKTRSSRPAPVSFEQWVNLPGRNFFRTCTTIEQRTNTLKSPMDREALLTWWKKVPRTRHPITDASKWSFDSWYFDDNNDRISAVIQGEFEELPSGTYRSFTRTFILGAPPAGSAAAAKQYPCIVLSDQMVVHSYLGTGSFDSKSSLVQPDIAIVPPNGAVLDEAGQKALLIKQVRARTGMNDAYSEMCLAQNDWDVERAVANFQEIRGSIPADAFV